MTMYAKTMRQAREEMLAINEAKYDLYHKDFSSAMQHAYKMAKKLHGITVDPKEIDDKVATGPKKPSSGKTNSYRLKGDKGAIQVQVANLDNKKYELNMYKEEVELDEKLDIDKRREASQGDWRVTNKELGVWTGPASSEKEAKEKAMRKFGVKKSSYLRYMKSTKAVKEEVQAAVEQLSKIKGNTPADKGRRAAVEDDIERAEKKGDKKLVKKLKEGTWKMPKNKKQIAPLLKLMRKPVKLGKEGDDAADVVRPYIGDDELLDDLYVAGKKNPNGDARPAIRDALERFGLPWEEAYELGTDEYRKYLEDLTPMESARSDAMKAMRKDKSMVRGKDSADVDDDASDVDVKAASKNILQQMRKASNLGGKFEVEFLDKKKVKVKPEIANAFIKMYQDIRKPADKEKFQNQAMKSYKDMLKVLKDQGAIAKKDFMRMMMKAGYNMKEETILDRIDAKLKERKNG